MPLGDVKVFSPRWWELIEHAIREGGRIGVNIGMFNCPGWSQSGGPWIKPDQAMRYLVSSETRVTGPQQFRAKAARAEGALSGRGRARVSRAASADAESRRKPRNRL